MSEQGEIKRDGARAVPNSGRGTIKKGDAILGDMTIDYKEYEKSYSVSRSSWAKICTDAAKNGLDQIPVLKIILGNYNKVRLAVVEWSYLEYLKECERKLMELEGDLQ
jgi:hypothetical protein